jgi:hypothetical protein
MNSGWIALHRKIYNSSDFDNQLEVAVFLYLVAMASHKPAQVVYRKKSINLNRGEVAIAYRDLAKKFKLSTKNIITIIKNIIKSGNLKQTLHKNLSVYSIVKYSKYQDVESKEKQKLADRTTTITNYTTSIDKNKIKLSNMTNKPKPTLPKFKSLQSKIVEPVKVKNEWEMGKEKLDAQDYERWVLHKLNS